MKLGAWGALLAWALSGCGGEPAETPGRQYGTLLGRVMLAPDVPASGCKVVLDGTGYGGFCNSAGEYVIRGVSAGQYPLIATAPESGEVAPRTVQVGASAGVISNLETIVLGKPGAIGGRILNAELADLTLAIVGIDGTGLVTAPSDRRAYWLTGVPPGVHDVTLVTETGVIVRKGVLVAPGRTTTGIDLDLAMVKVATGALEGTAVRAEDGPGGSGGIGVELRSALTGQLIGTAVKTGADGSFSLPVPRQGAYAVRATAGARSATLGGVLFAGGQQRLLTRLVIPLADDLDGDGRGAADDDDDDGDGVLDGMDAFDDDFSESVDADADGLGDEADLANTGGQGIDVRTPTPDTDSDGKFDFEDSCVMRPNPMQEDVDADGVGDACDNCPRTANPDQRDGDMDEVGDACPPATVTCGTRGARCGELSDGAGGSLDCGECPMGQSCGAGGRANQCAPTCATATSCPPGRCGTIPDGCGGTLTCLTCALPNVCGAAGTCVPCTGLRTCAVDECGSGPDGCGLGRTLQCTAVCPGTQTCGGGGTANRCGVGMNQLAVGSGQAQTGYPGQPLAPVVVQVTRAGTPIVGATVTVLAQNVGASFLGSNLVTNTAGQVSFTPILGRVAGPYVWQVVAAGAAGGGSVDVTASATAPVGSVAGTVVPVVNQARIPGSSPADVSGPAAQARPSANMYDLAIASDGTAYFSDGDFNAVFAVSPTGELRRVAGHPDGQGGFSGDLGPATQAHLSAPREVVLDEARQLLYIADQGNRRVRVVDVSVPDGVIQTFAGGGDPGQPPPYGEGGPATSASLDQIAQLELDGDGSLFISDHNEVRRIERSTGTIRTVVPSDPCNSNNSRLSRCAFERCRFARDAAGTLFISGALCSGNTGARTGIVRVEADGTQVPIAGGYATATSGMAALDASVGQITGLAFDRGGQLFFSNTVNQLWRIDRAGLLFLVSGGGAAGGDFGPASQATWLAPRGLAFAGDDLYVVDAGAASIRMIGAAGSASQPVMLARAGGNGQQTELGRGLPLSLDVMVSLGTTMLPGVTVGVRALQAGAALPSASAVSDVSGVARAFVRASLTPGPHVYELSLRDIHGAHVSGSPAMFMATAVAPSAGTTFYAINSERVQADQSAGPGTLLRINTPHGLVVDRRDGTAYVVDTAQNVVLAMDPSGLVRVVAGLPSMPGFGGDFGPALAARLSSPDALALNEAANLLYVSDQENNRVRAIEIGATSMRRIYTVAGGGSAGPPNYGDGGPGTQATVLQPNALALDSDGNLWIWSIGNSTLRKLDAGGDISTLDIGYRGGRPYAPNCYTHVDGCRLAFAGGRLLMSANVGGVPVSYDGVLEIDRVTGVTSPFAGAPAGTASDGSARTAVFQQLGELAADPAGRLIIMDTLGHKLYAISLDAARTLTPVLGTGAAGAAGDYVAATSATVTSFVRPAVGPGGHIWFTDSDNHALRVIW